MKSLICYYKPGKTILTGPQAREFGFKTTLDTIDIDNARIAQLLLKCVKEGKDVVIQMDSFKIQEIDQ